MNGKIRPQHTERMAYVYIRQSTMGQVLHHQESTERQYGFKDKAISYGWPIERVRVLDADLGISGTQMTNRPDFRILVADVSLAKVGAVFALEASRLSRSSMDWNRLFELCSLTDTLIVDEDGCYDPADFNDQLLLGLKGIMSQAELHFIRARLQGGKLNKAKKGLLRHPLPVGYCYDEEGAVIVDPDEEVRAAVKLLFETFRQSGSGYAVVQNFARLGLKFPKRAYGGVWKGRLIWGQLRYERVAGILKNPCYAGAYVYGRYRYRKSLSTDGGICSKIEAVPMSHWPVSIQEHHEGYIRWEEFLHNLALLEANRTNAAETLLPGPAREGLALLQGLLVCGGCGRRLTVRYRGNGGLYPIYECNWRKRDGLSGTSCLNVRCDLLDTPVSARVLEVLEPQQLTIALKAIEQLEAQSKAADGQWRLRVQRAEYEAQLAQRRYEEVDPANRLVASTLEKRWNETLLNLEQVKQQHQEFLQKSHLQISPETRQKVLALAEDLPRLWKAATTQAKDRKRVLRLLLKDITVEKPSEPKKLILHVRWQGGATEDIPCALPPRMCDRVRYRQKTVERVRDLAKSLPDEKIAEALNGEGVPSAKGGPFTASKVRNIRSVHRVPFPHLKGEEELTVKEVAAKFGVSTHVVYYWIERGYVRARRLKQGLPLWITLRDQDEEDLRRRIAESYKLHPKEAARS